MDIRQLRYFVAIAEAPSLSAAALHLGVAQPSLSQHVTKMEVELGVSLLDRSPRGSMLTAEGQVLLRHAREITTAMDHCLDEMRDVGGAPRGKVGFGLPPSVSMVLSVPLAETVRVESPDIRLRAVEAMSGYIKAWVEDGTVDLGFIYDLKGAEHFRARHVLDERLHVYAAPDNWPFVTPPGTPVPLAALEGLEMILPEAAHGLRRTIEGYARPLGLSLNVTIEMDAMTQIKELVARGSGHAIFSPSAVHDAVARGDLVGAPLADPEMVRPVWLVSNPARPTSSASRAVEAITLDVIRDLVGRGIWEGTLRP
ncbi:MAG: LysR family transcriptional regulator [Roseovarius sp.]